MDPCATFKQRHREMWASFTPTAVFTTPPAGHLVTFAGGTFSGQLNYPHSIAAGSAGNLYVTETLEGKRVQKFTFTGMKTAVPLSTPPQPR